MRILLLTTTRARLLLTVTLITRQLFCTVLETARLYFWCMTRGLNYK